MKTKKTLDYISDISIYFIDKRKKDEKYKDLFEKIKSRFEVNTFQTKFLIALFIESINDMDNENADWVFNSSITKLLGISNIDLLKKLDNLKSLYNYGMIYFQDNEDLTNNKGFKVSKIFFESIIYNTPFKKFKTHKVIMTPIVFSDCVDKAMMKSEKSSIPFRREYIFSSLENANMKKCKFIRDLKALIPEIMDRIIFYQLLLETYYGEPTKNLLNLVRRVSTTDTNVPYIVKNTAKSSNPLVKLKFINICQSDNLEDIEIKLGRKGKEVLFGENIEPPNDNIIDTSKCKKVDLYYDNNTTSQINQLTDCLSDKHFSEIQNRLKNKGMPTGFVALFYGDAGTGKTESVYQIAKATDRQILHLDISETKSCWFGESEKRIKEIFSDYREMYENCISNHKKIPIFLFNEADAVISKRITNMNSSLAQTENAIQNIILEELETFPGIMIATTNLADNFDPAFERRFLFKIKFTKPNADIKTKIWKSKLPYLSDDNAKLLAGKYDFSGGEIANVVKKSTIDEILSGNESTVEVLESMCKDEKLKSTNNSNHIGFGAD